ncbi:hypothetical protein D5274_10520 [bacterium 1XD42-94]|jgi:hypothetical protein|nr:hypothetical protein [bacterium 1XD42-76]NBK05567.1 hypothetical protein [bacterium 1XD42-94]
MFPPKAGGGILFALPAGFSIQPHQIPSLCRKSSVERCQNNRAFSVVKYVRRGRNDLTALGGYVRIKDRKYRKRHKSFPYDDSCA